MPPTLNHCFKNSDSGDFFNKLGYTQTSKTASSDVRFAPDIAHSGLVCAFSAINFKLRRNQILAETQSFAAESWGASSQRNTNVAAVAPSSCATMKPGASTGRMPEKVSVRLRAMVTAGLAKEVEAVNQ